MRSCLFLTHPTDRADHTDDVAVESQPCIVRNRSHLVVVCRIILCIAGLLCKCFVEGSVSKFMRDVNL